MSRTKEAEVAPWHKTFWQSGKGEKNGLVKEHLSPQLSFYSSALLCGTSRHLAWDTLGLKPFMS